MQRYITFIFYYFAILLGFIWSLFILTFNISHPVLCTIKKNSKMNFRNFKPYRSPFIKTRGITTLTSPGTPILIIIFPILAGFFAYGYITGLHVLPSGGGGGAMPNPSVPTTVYNTQDLIEMLKAQLNDIDMIRRNNMYILRTSENTLNLAIKDLHFNLDYVKNNHPEIQDTFVQY